LQYYLSIKGQNFVDNALEVQLNISGKHSKEFYQLSGNLANSAFILGQLKRAEKMFKELIEIQITIISYEQRNWLHEDFHKVAVIHTKMAHIHVELG
jgi:ribosome-associated translation inhibitor RaiA